MEYSFKHVFIFNQHFIEKKCNINFLKKIRATVNKRGLDMVKNVALSLKKYVALYPKMRGPTK